MGNFFGDLFLGKKQQNIPMFNPQIMKMLEGMAPDAYNKMQSNQFDFAPIEQQARANFQSKTLPGIAERFTAMGDNKNSSNFMGALGSAGAGLEMGLGAMKQDYNLQQQGNLMNLMQMGMKDPYYRIGAQPGMLQGMSQGLGQGSGEVGIQMLMKLLPMLLAA